MNSKTTWKIVGAGSDTRIAEFTLDHQQEKVMTYGEAKAAALQTLKAHVAPLLARIEELEQDQFLKAGALPPLKAWRQRYGGQAVVTAQTKKRAMEIVDESRYGFNSSWDECKGDWWYHLAHEEAIWMERQDAEKQGTGIFYKPLDRDEGQQLLEQHVAPYRVMDVSELLWLVGNQWNVTGIGLQGTPYKISGPPGGFFFKRPMPEE